MTNEHRRVRAAARILAAVFFLLAPLTKVHGGSGGYFVTYDSKVDKGELELMLMSDWTQPSDSNRLAGMGDTLSHMVELEYGITSQMATELMIEWFEDTQSGERLFTGFRWENRYRLLEREIPLNPMVYAEYEDLSPLTRYKMEVSGWTNPPYPVLASAATRERILETRLVLSQDLGGVNFAFNWINETETEGGHTAFGYSLGILGMAGGGGEAEEYYTCSMHPEVHEKGPGHCAKCGMDLKEVEPGGSAVGVGLEFYGGLGDSVQMGWDPSRQQHYFGPILMFHPAPRWMVHAQLAIGLTPESDELVRFNIGREF